MAQCRIARAVLGCPLEQTRDSPEETAGARRRLGAPSVLIARCEYERDAERSVRDTAGCAGSARGRSRISRISVCTSCGSADHAEQVPRVMPPRPWGYTDRLAACAARCCSGSFRYLPSTNIRFTSFTAGSDPAPGCRLSEGTDPGVRSMGFALVSLRSLALTCQPRALPDSSWGYILPRAIVRLERLVIWSLY